MRRSQINMKSILAIILLFALSYEYIPITEAAPYIPRPAIPSELEEVEEVSTSESQEDGSVNKESNSQDTRRRNESDTSSHSGDIENNQDESSSLLSTEAIVYSANAFDNDKDLANYRKYLEESPKTQHQFKVREDSEKKILYVNYTDQAILEGQPILLFADTQLDNREQADTLMEDTLNIYPDLLVKGEIVEEGKKYNMVFAIRPTVKETGDLWFDGEGNRVEYEGQRTAYTYEVKQGQEDKYRPAIERAFPGAFEFTSKKEGAVDKVTMTPTTQSTQEEPALVERDLSLLDRLNMWFTNLFSNIDLRAFLDQLGIPEQHHLKVIFACVILLIVLAALIVVLGRR